MKRIAIFCDGTWLRDDAEHGSNVVRLSRALLGTAPDGVRQQGFYLPGVGTGQGLKGLSAKVDRVTGGALGWGLDAAILDAYRSLIRAWEPGDEVFVFGFSRGAYTARSLVGLMRRAGIMAAVHADRVAEAMELYRARPKVDPDDERLLRLRARCAPATATSAAEIAWREARGLPAPERVMEVAYLGVWDTVGALGVPGHLTVAPLFNRRHQFHDTDLSATVARARHAVAVDERRLSFVPTLWTNLPDLNRGALGLPPRGDVSRVPVGALPYRQEWFPGDHGAVGGGNAALGLSSYACGWIADGAADAGLAFDGGAVEAIRDACRIGDALLTRRTGGLAQLWREGDREGPDDPRDVSEAARERLRAFADYAPKALERVVWAFRPDPTP